MFRALVVAVFCLGFGAACDQADGPAERLIPPGDQDFVKLEQPEAAGECQNNTECEASCIHGCVPLSSGPTTCPADPPPLPARLEDATCRCDGDSLCAWYPVVD